MLTVDPAGTGGFVLPTPGLRAQRGAWPAAGAQRMLGGQAAVWITLVTAEQRLARQWAERTQGTEPRREPPALDLEMPQNGTGRRGQGPLVKSVNGARDPLPLLTPGGSEGSLPPSLGATDVTNVFSFNSGGSRGKKKPLILHFRGSPGIRSAAHPETNPTLASGMERDGFGAARPKLARQQICPLAANLQTLFGLCASVSLDTKWHNEGLDLFRRLLGGDLCRGPRMVSGKRQMLRKCCFIIIFVDQSPSPTAHPLLHAQRLRQPGSEPRTPGERGERAAHSAGGLLLPPAGEPGNRTDAASLRRAALRVRRLTGAARRRGPGSPPPWGCGDGEARGTDGLFHRPGRTSGWVAGCAQGTGRWGWCGVTKRGDHACARTPAPTRTHVQHLGAQTRLYTE